MYTQFLTCARRALSGVEAVAGADELGAEIG
jgi:hypothetical protein